MKGNIDECHLLMSKDKSSDSFFTFKVKVVIKGSECEKLLGIKRGSKLYF